MSEGDVARLEAILDALKSRFERHEQQVGQMIAEQTAVLRDMAEQVARSDAIKESLHKHEEDVDELSDTCHDVSRRLQNCESSLGTMKWIGGALVTALLPAVGAAAMFWLRHGG